VSHCPQPWQWGWHRKSWCPSPWRSTHTQHWIQKLRRSSSPIGAVVSMLTMWATFRHNVHELSWQLSPPWPVEQNGCFFFVFWSFKSLEYYLPPTLTY
jgi:disulfide bond formation protein DsbB